jgi:hypothetical protein
VKKLYKKIFSITQNRKNELLRSSSSNQSSIQLSSSIQASSSFSSSITSTIRTQYESNTRQNRYIDIRNQQSAESRHENRQFNSESRQKDRSFISESRYDREPDRSRNRQYEFAEYAVTRYADENLRSMNLTRRASQSDYQTSKSYVSSSSAKVIYATKLSALNKLYKNEEKFENTENNFDFKLIIYLDKCKFADLSEHVYEKDV